MTDYKTDIAAWAAEQAELLRAAAASGGNLPLDWEHIIEEIEAVARSERDTLGSQIQRIIEHLLKLQFSPDQYSRQGWQDSIDDARGRIERVLDRNRALRREVGGMIAVETRRAMRATLRKLARYHELTPEIEAQIKNTTYSEEQVLGPEFFS